MKLGYLSFIPAPQSPVRWWSKKIWRIKAIKAPPKAIFHFWLGLKNRSLTWDILMHFGFQGPGLYFLCRSSEETCSHLLVDCSYFIEVWRKMSKLVNISPLWKEFSVDYCFKNSFSSPSLVQLRPLPIILA